METKPDAPVIVNAHGQPARAADATCPQCGAGADRRRASAGFGDPHPVCGKCGHEFIGEKVAT